MKSREFKFRIIEYFIHETEDFLYRIKSRKIQYLQPNDSNWTEIVQLQAFGQKPLTLEQRRNNIIIAGWKVVSEEEARQHLSKILAKIEKQQAQNPYGHFSSLKKSNGKIVEQVIYDDGNTGVFKKATYQATVSDDSIVYKAKPTKKWAFQEIVAAAGLPFQSKPSAEKERVVVELKSVESLKESYDYSNGVVAIDDEPLTYFDSNSVVYSNNHNAVPENKIVEKISENVPIAKTTTYDASEIFSRYVGELDESAKRKM